MAPTDNTVPPSRWTALIDGQHLRNSRSQHGLTRDQLAGKAGSASIPSPAWNVTPTPAADPAPWPASPPRWASPRPPSPPARHHPAMHTADSAALRRVLGQHLRDLRNQAGLTMKMAAGLMEWSEPKLWRAKPARPPSAPWTR